MVNIRHVILKQNLTEFELNWFSYESQELQKNIFKVLRAFTHAESY